MIMMGLKQGDSGQGDSGQRNRPAGIELINLL